MGTIYEQFLFDSANINSDYSITESGVTCFTQVQGVYNAPVLVPNGTGKSLQISMPVSANLSASDRIEYIWVPESSPNAPAFDGRAKFLAFAMQVIPGSSMPVLGNPVVTQFWQGGSSTYKYSPPVYLEIYQGTWELRLCIKNDDTGKFIANPPIVAWPGAIPVGTMRSYALEVLPNYSGSGVVKLWIDGSSVAAYGGKVGYTPQSLGGDIYILDTMRVKTGLYRHDGNPAISTLWDAVKFSNSL